MLEGVSRPCCMLVTYVHCATCCDVTYVHCATCAVNCVLCSTCRSVTYVLVLPPHFSLLSSLIVRSPLPLALPFILHFFYIFP